MSQVVHHSNNWLCPEHIEHRSDASDENVTIHQVLGDRIEIFWLDDNAFYPGMVAMITDNGGHNAVYDDGDIKTLEIANEQ